MCLVQSPFTAQQPAKIGSDTVSATNERWVTGVCRRWPYRHLAVVRGLGEQEVLGQARVLLGDGELEQQAEQRTAALTQANGCMQRADTPPPARRALGLLTVLQPEEAPDGIAVRTHQLHLEGGCVEVVQRFPQQLQRAAVSQRALPIGRAHGVKETKRWETGARWQARYRWAL